MAKDYQSSRAATCAHFRNGCCPFTGGVCRDGLRSVVVGGLWKCPAWKSKKKSAAARRRWRTDGKASFGNVGMKRKGER